jgi:hypothetical protein
VPFDSRSLSSPRARKLVCFAAFIVCVLVSAGQTPYGDAFGFSDHFTHMNAARLFPRVGTALWRTPIDDMFPPASDAPSAPADVRAAGTVRDVAGWPRDKPFVGGWTQLARPYPPGDLLVVAPVALAYHLTSLSFASACHLLIVTFLALAHVAAYVAWRDAPKGRDGWQYFASGAIAYVYLVFWTLRGFYDVAAVLPLVLAAAYFGTQRWLAGLLAFGVALFCHYRALFYAPWALFALWQLARVSAWKTWRSSDWLAAAAAAALAFVSVATFVLVTPALGRVPFENPIHPGHIKIVPLLVFCSTMAVALAAFVRRRSNLDVAMALWIGLMLVSARQVQSWHAILMLPWLFAPAATYVVRAARVQLVAVVTLAVFL